MTKPAAAPDALETSEPIETDAVIIGAGPCGLFAVFELGLLDIKAHVIDILDRPGGQCAELYPEKPIYDVPALPVVTGQELTDRLMEQIKPFGPVFHFSERIDALSRTRDGRFRLTSDAGTEFLAKVVVVAAGGGSFTPKRPPLDGIEAYEGKSVFYSVRKMETMRGRDVVIVGGGDSALDWTLNLAPVAKSLTLIHRRDEFRAAPHSVEKMRKLVAEANVRLLIGQVTTLEGDGRQLSALDVKTASADGARPVQCHAALLRTDDEARPGRRLGPQSSREPHPRRHRTFRDRARTASSRSAISIAYPGKLKLILSGFHEAALMAQAAYKIVYPGKKLLFQYTTSSSSLQKKLGVK